MPNGADIAKAYVQIIPSADGIKGRLTEALGGEAAAAGTNAGGVFGKVFGTAAKIKMLATGAVAAAVTKFTKDALDAYADYEQLAGGVKKIFDEADIAGIINDANEAYYNLNMSANEYLEAINKTGATFAMTMGDQKGYDTAKKGMQAIANYASGTGANLSLLNEKFGMITRSTSSYQSIADQFAGILPATSADFLEQAQAAGFLSESYKKLTDVPIAEYQEAIAEMLERGVDGMGLLGNTAKESFGTISGSIAATKSAWQNLLAGFANPDADIEALVTNLVNSAGAAAEQIIPVVGRILATVASVIGDAIVRLVDRLLTAGAEAIVSFAEGIGSKLGELVKKGNEAIISFLQGIAAKIASVVQKGREILDSVKQGIANGISSLVDVGMNIVRGIWQGISNGLGWIKSRIQGWVGNVMSFLKNLFGIHSPSAVMRDEVGRFLALGIGEGFSDEMVSVERQMQSAMPDLTASYSVSGSRYAPSNGEMGLTAQVSALRDELRNMKIYLDTGLLVGAVDEGLQTRAMTQARRALA